MLRYRTIFISDTHLGTQGCQAEMLLDFLQRHEADRIYLVGDIVDAWRLGKGWVWPQSHNDVVQALLRKARDGTRIIFIPGNHDDGLRAYPGTHFGGIEVVTEAEHRTADGRRFLVTHGDQFDAVVMHARWLARIGDRAYDVALSLNTWLDRVRQLWGGSYWSLSNWAKQRVKRAVNYISEYEAVLSAEARRGGFDGVICGHIHRANSRRINGIDYVNTGDWVESCTAVIERIDGTLHVIEWTDALTRRRRARRTRVALPGIDLVTDRTVPNKEAV